MEGLGIAAPSSAFPIIAPLIRFVLTLLPTVMQDGRRERGAETRCRVTCPIQQPDRTADWPPPSGRISRAHHISVLRSQRPGAISPATARCATTEGCCAMNDITNGFLQAVAIQNSIQAAFGMSKIFDGKDDKEREAFKRDLGNSILSISQDYTRPVCDEFHIANIIRLSRDMSFSHRQILFNGRLRIGTSQKALNLYLKFAWSHGWIAKPPHCPFDSIVLAELDLSGHCCEKCRLWTKMDCVSCYRYWVDRAKEKVQECPVCVSLSDWEVCIWNKASLLKKQLNWTCDKNRGLPHG